jgi:hypothetical protein
MKKNIILFLLLLLCISCNNLKDRNSFNSVEDLPHQNISSKRLSTDFFLASPYQLELTDSLLWIMDDVDGYQIAIYNLSKKQMTGRVIKKGQGPMEVLSPLSMDISIDGHNLLLLQRQNGVLTGYSIKGLLEDSLEETKKLQFKQADRFVEIKTGCLTMGAYDDGMFGIWSEKGERLNTINVYPEYINHIGDPMSKYRLNQGYAAYNSKDNNMVFASYFTGDIVFYNLNNNDFTEMKRINIGNNRLKKRIQNSGNTNLTGEDIVYCYGINSTDDDFYILYSGERMDNSQKAKHAFILRYSSKGDFIQCYKTDISVTGFCVDQKSNKIYAISLSEDLEYIIVEFLL